MKKTNLPTNSFSDTHPSFPFKTGDFITSVNKDLWYIRRIKVLGYDEFGLWGEDMSLEESSFSKILYCAFNDMDSIRFYDDAKGFISLIKIRQ